MNDLQTRNLDGVAITRTCALKGREGRYMLVRMGTNNSRVASLQPPRGEGFIVPNSKLENIEGVYNTTSNPTERRWFIQPSYYDMPYGLQEVNPVLVSKEDKIRCCVAACEHFLMPPRRGQAGEVCPDHGVYTHRSGTYTYPKQEAEKNIIEDRPLFNKLNNHPFKFESRCQNECSEDAVSYNVMASYKKAGLLHELVHTITGQEVQEKDVKLYLWGIDTDSQKPWEMLIAARNRFERGLPQGRPFSEPDIMLRTPDHFIIVEAKLTSPNSYVAPGENRKSPISLTHEEVLTRYDTSDLFFRRSTLNLEQAKTRPFPQQLLRYWQLGEWMRFMADVPQFWLVNLTRMCHEVQSQDDFRALLHPNDRERFQVLSWEQIYHMTMPHRHQLSRLRTYLENKTVGLRQCFALGRVWRA